MLTELSNEHLRAGGPPALSITSQSMERDGCKRAGTRVFDRRVCTPSAVRVWALIVLQSQPSAQLGGTGGDGGGSGGVLRKVHERTPVVLQHAADDLTKATERRADRSLIVTRRQISQPEHAVELARPGRNFLMLQHSGANGASV
jgi:hypothetical protein